MRTFEEQRREFVELAMKLIDNKKYQLHIDSDQHVFAIYKWVKLNYSSDYTPITIARLLVNDLQKNETETQKLRDLVEELR